MRPWMVVGAVVSFVTQTFGGALVLSVANNRVRAGNLKATIRTLFWMMAVPIL
jgi:hypothetical protein